MEQVALADKLKLLRARTGLTLTQAAAGSGVGRDTIAALEHGKRPAQMPTLTKLAHGYGVPVDELLENVSPKAPAPSLPPNAGERRSRQYPWMADSFVRLINRWYEVVEERENPEYSRSIVVACFDAARAVLDTVTAPKEERIEIANFLENLAVRAHAHYKESKKAAAAAAERDYEERRAEMRRHLKAVA
jgi:transcriptional regulator with XRE-family HTH domain